MFPLAVCRLEIVDLGAVAEEPGQAVLGLVLLHQLAAVARGLQTPGPCFLPGGGAGAGLQGGSSAAPLDAAPGPAAAQLRQHLRLHVQGRLYSIRQAEGVDLPWKQMIKIKLRKNISEMGTSVHKRCVLKNSKTQSYLIIHRISRVKKILKKYVERTFFNNYII